MKLKFLYGCACCLLLFLLLVSNMSVHLPTYKSIYLYLPTNLHTSIYHCLITCLLLPTYEPILPNYFLTATYKINTFVHTYPYLPSYLATYKCLLSTPFVSMSPVLIDESQFYSISIYLAISIDRSVCLSIDRSIDRSADRSYLAFYPSVT